MTTSQPFSSVRVWPPGIWIASTSRVSCVRSMRAILDPAAAWRQEAGAPRIVGLRAAHRQPAPRQHVAHGERDQDGEPEEAAARDHPDEPRALPQVHEEEDDEERLGERDRERD